MSSPLSELEVIVVIGASGFIGQHLLPILAATKGVEVRILVHQQKTGVLSNIVFVKGSLLEPHTLDELIKPGCTVINLAYLSSLSIQDNLDAITNLAEACTKKRIKRLIHCSTAVVAGRILGNFIDENTVCNPVSEYEKTKFKLENILLEKSLNTFEIVILRPAAVFGPKGKNLLKLANSLTKSGVLVNYVKSCLFGHRSMNLVCVGNVAAALIFLMETDKKIDRETFIISDDDSSINNYRDVEDRIINKLKTINYPIPRIILPSILLKFALKLAGKSLINIETKYSDAKLSSYGFKKPFELEVCLDEFTAWYCNNCGKAKDSVN